MGKGSFEFHGQPDREKTVWRASPTVPGFSWAQEATSPSSTTREHTQTYCPAGLPLLILFSTLFMKSQACAQTLMTITTVTLTLTLTVHRLHSSASDQAFNCLT